MVVSIVFDSFDNCQLFIAPVCMFYYFLSRIAEGKMRHLGVGGRMFIRGWYEIANEFLSKILENVHFFPPKPTPQIGCTKSRFFRAVFPKNR